jgi:type VI secretion system protein ImpK
MAWGQRGQSVVVPVGRAGQPAGAAERPALRDLFTDLMAYGLFFQASCGEQPPPLGEVRDRTTALIEEQEKRARAGEAVWETYQEARFAVLAWLDELILTSPWPHRGQWQHLMLRLYGTLNAGKEFFDRLERIPAAAREVREMYYLCLALGFQGKYALADSPQALAQLRRTLYHELAGAPNELRPSEPRLFPEAYRKPSGNGPRLPRIHPLWFGLAVLVPVLLFGIYFWLLRAETSRLIARIEEPVIVAPPPPPLDWTRSLVEELRRKSIEARDTPRGVLVTLPGVLFEVNRSDLSRDGARRIEDVAQALKRHAPERLVAVEGHASREKGTLDEANQRLSEDRAKRVAEVLVGSGLRPERVTAKGLGSAFPVASNDTEEGRRLNRRVEMIVEKTGEGGRR